MNWLDEEDNFLSDEERKEIEKCFFLQKAFRNTTAKYHTSSEKGEKEESSFQKETITTLMVFRPGKTIVRNRYQHYEKVGKNITPIF